MKISILFQLFIISMLLVLISSKNIDSIVYGSGRIGNSSESTLVVRQVTSDPSSVQIVSELGESEEVTSSGLLNNDLNESSVEGGSSGSKPVTEKPVLAEPAVVDNAVDTPVNENDPNPINKYCSCSSATCKCCREFGIPLIPIRGPGCATIRYLDNDRMTISIKYGDFVLASRQIDGRKATPICLPLPGGYNRFCGRVYGVTRKDDNFRACLGLELRADDDVEASLRVSCFEFGPRGLATVEADPLPPIEDSSEEEDEDDDEDILGIDAIAGEDDDDDDDDDAGAGGGILGDVIGGAVGGDDDDDDFDGGFSFFRSAGNLIGGIFGSNAKVSDKKKPNEAIQIKRHKKYSHVEQKSSISRIDTDVSDGAETPASDVSTEDSAADVSSTEKSLKPETKQKKKSKKKSKGILDEIEDVLEDYAEDVMEKSSGEGKINKKENSISGEQKKDETDEHYHDKDEVLDKEEDDEEDDEDDEEDDDDEDDDGDDDDESAEYDEKVKTDASSSAEKPTKKKKVKSSYGLGYLGRLLNFFNYK